jgi:predicted DNA-binding transcriptional regulator AlpA
MHTPLHLRTPAAAEYVGLSASTLEKLRLTGGGPAYFKSGRKIVVYSTADLDAWLARCRQGRLQSKLESEPSGGN